MRIRMNDNLNYLQAKEVKFGDTLTILNPGIERPSKWLAKDKDGKEIPGKFKSEYIFDVDFNGDKKQLRMSYDSRVNMIKAFGEETESWVGKSVKLSVSNGTFGSSIILHPVVEE